MCAFCIECASQPKLALRRMVLEQHCHSYPRTPFCHFVALHPQGSVSLDSRVASLPHESSSLATSRGNKKFEEKNRESYTSCTTPAFPLWWLAPPPCPRKRGHYKAPLCCERLMKGVFRGVLFCPPEQGEVWRSRIGGRAQRVSQQNVFHVIW